MEELSKKEKGLKDKDNSVVIIGGRKFKRAKSQKIQERVFKKKR